MKITICGSMAFYPQMQEAQQALVALGHEVMIPRLDNELPPEFGGGRTINFARYVEQHGGIQSFPPGDQLWDYKEEAMRDHFSKIDWCDAILVVNPDKHGVKGYVGGNTLMEMGVAFYQHKPVYVLNDISPELSYKQEILGMKPVVLKGDVQRIAAPAPAAVASNL